MGDVMPARTVAEVRERRAALEQRIARVDRPWRHPVDVLAVTKGFAPEVVELAVDAGCTAIGENYAQELLTRVPVLERLAERRPTVYFIGHLQSNKVRQLAGVVDVWGTVDRVSLAAEIAKRAPGAQVLVQLNATGETQKSGCAPEEAAALIEACRDLGLDVVGVLAMGPTDGDPSVERSAFDAARRIVDEHGLAVCSVGMSGDIESAVAAGSTQVRVGTALFGARPPR